MLVRILIGLGMVAVGAVITIYANKIYESVGPIAWAEEHLGTEGGSRLMYKLIGIGLCIIGFLLATGMLGGLLLGIARFFFPGLGNAPPTNISLTE